MAIPRRGARHALVDAKWVENRPPPTAAEMDRLDRLFGVEETSPPARRIPTAPTSTGPEIRPASGDAIA
ncbi:MAG: hypothetical protein OEL76_04960 [Siculibacillus sp.]|nr:hypothetical protein [Siculibacillus sp.]